MENGFSLLKTEDFFFISPPPPNPAAHFQTDQNSFPIFGCVFCRTHLIPLLVLFSPPPPFPLLLHSEGHRRDPRVGLHVCHHCPQRDLLRASGSLLCNAFTFTLSNCVKTYCEIKTAAFHIVFYSVIKNQQFWHSLLFWILWYGSNLTKSNCVFLSSGNSLSGSECTSRSILYSFSSFYHPRSDKT